MKREVQKAGLRTSKDPDCLARSLLYHNSTSFPIMALFSPITNNILHNVDGRRCIPQGSQLQTRESIANNNSSSSNSVLPWWFSGKASACQCRRLGFYPWVGKMPWRRAWQPTLVFLPGKSYGQRSLAGYSPWDHKESDLTEQLNNNQVQRQQ